MHTVSPVYTEAEKEFEYTIAKEANGTPVVAIPVTLDIVDPETGAIKHIPSWGVSLRFRLTAEELAAVMTGSDIVLTQMLCGQRFQPVNLQVCAPGVRPEFKMPDDEPEEKRGPHCPTCMRQQAGDDMEDAAHQSGTLEHPAESPDEESMRLQAEARGKVVEMPTKLADICPSCGETDKKAAYSCNNKWHSDQRAN